MNWQKDKLTIIGFGIIFVILGVFGYILWDMNREPMAEVSVTEPTPAPAPATITAPTKTDPKVVDPEPVEKEALPDYPITKVDTNGWINREIKVGSAGLKYKVPSAIDSEIGEPNPLRQYSLPKLYLDGADKKFLIGGSDFIGIGPCLACDVPYYATVSINIIKTKELNLKDIENVFATQTCEFNIVKLEESDYFMNIKYVAEPKCQTKETAETYSYSSNSRKNQRLDEFIKLRVEGENISQYKNPFSLEQDNVSKLLQYPVISVFGVKDSDIEVEDPNTKKLSVNDQILYIIDLSNNNFAVISYEVRGFPEKVDSEKVNNLMHTILSTIEVL